MYGNAFGGKRQNLLQRFLKALKCLLRQPRDKVGIDMCKARLPCKLERVDCLLCGVLPAYAPEHAVVQCLRVDTDAPAATAFDCFQLLHIDGVRPPGLDGKFPAGG